MLKELQDLNFGNDSIANVLTNAGYTYAITDDVSEFCAVRGTYRIFPVTEIPEDIAPMIVDGFTNLYFVKGSHYNTNSAQGQMAVMASYDNPEAANGTLNSLKESFGAASEGISLTALQEQVYTYQPDEVQPATYHMIFAVEVIMGEPKEYKLAVNKFSFEEMDALEMTVTEYLADGGYTDCGKNFNGIGEVLSSDVSYIYSTPMVGSDIYGDFPSEMENASNIIVVVESSKSNGSESKVGYYLNCANAEDAKAFYNMRNDLFGDSVVHEKKYNTEVFLGIENKSSSGEGEVNKVISPLNFDFDSLCNNGTEYLKECGYTSAKAMESMNDMQYFMFASEDMSELGFPGCESLMLIKGIDGNSKVTGIFGKCDTKANMEATITLALDGEEAKVYRVNENNQFYVVVVTGSVSSGVRPLSDFDIKKMEAEGKDVVTYLNDMGYTNSGKSFNDFMNIMDGKDVHYIYSNPHPGSEIKGDLPDSFMSASLVTMIAEYIINNGNDSFTGMYVECAKEAHAQEIYDNAESWFGGSTTVIFNKQIFGTKVFFIMDSHYVPSEPTNPRRSIVLSNIIETSGEHTVEIAPYNYDKNGNQQEGPRATHLVKVQGFGFIVDNEGVNIVHQRNGAVVNEALECGMNLHLSTKDESKMLPENVDVSGGFSNGYYYNRQDDNYRFGWLNIHGPVNGDIYVNFGELPDYTSDKQIAFLLQTAPASVFKQEFIADVDNWETFASYEDNQFIFDPKVKELQYNLDGVTYYVGTYNGTYYNKVRNTTISKNNVYYIVTDESLFNKPELVQFNLMLNGEVHKTYAVTQNTMWASAYTQLPEANFSSDGKIYYTIGTDLYQVMQYKDGVLIQVGSGDKVEAKDYILQYCIKAYFYDVNGNHLKTIVSNSTTWGEYINQDSAFSIDETSGIQQIVYKAADSQYYPVYRKLGESNDYITSNTTIISNENYYTDYVKPITVTLYGTGELQGKKYSIQTTKSTWAEEVASRTDITISDDGNNVMYEVDGISYALGQPNGDSYLPVHPSHRINMTNYLFVL